MAAKSGVQRGVKRHVGDMRYVLTAGPQVLDEVLVQMSTTDIGFGVLSRSANAFLAKADKDRFGVLSAAIQHTGFWDDPRIVTVLSRSDFRLESLKKKPMTVYIVMPPAKLAAYGRFMRGFVGLALAAITRQASKPTYNVAFFLDEFAQLGRISAVEDAMSLVRGYGAAMWIFVQDLSQLKGVYPKWQTFLANSAKQFYGTADVDTARYISESLGQTTIEYETTGHSESDTDFSRTHSWTQHFKGRHLLTPDEVMRLGPRPIVLIEGEYPYMLERLNYLRDPEYQGLADANPAYQHTTRAAR